MALRCDLIIRDATIFDGTGSPRRAGDLGVTGNRIVAIGDLGAASADREVIATGKALAPGFIDAHTHDDRAVLMGAEGTLCKISQGVTTVVCGCCGISLAPARFNSTPFPPLDIVGTEGWWRFPDFGDYAHEINSNGSEVNVYALVGAQTLRAEAMEGDVYRAATDREIHHMHTRVKQAMAEGASGYSTGLYYKPNMHATTEETIAVAEALKPYDGLYSTHMRDEANHVLASIEETMEIGKRAGVQVQISHHKCSLPENYGRSIQTLPLLEAYARTQQLAYDVYPYPAGSTVLMPDRLRDDVKVIITWSIPHPEMAGRYLHEIARGWNSDIQAAAEKLLPAGQISFQMDEDDVQRIMAHPMSMIGSDGIPHDTHPHPRLWGTFPRVLGHYSRGLGLFSMEVAIHKMTGRCAEAYGIVDRGVLREGAYADLVLFDPATVIDVATFENPKRPSIGIEEVWTNGVATFCAAKGATGERPGRLVTRGRAT